jgi:hypothetical protein
VCCSHVCNAQVISINLVQQNILCYFFKHHVEYVICCKMSQTDPPSRAGPHQQCTNSQLTQKPQKPLQGQQQQRISQEPQPPIPALEQRIAGAFIPYGKSLHPAHQIHQRQ